MMLEAVSTWHCSACGEQLRKKDAECSACWNRLYIQELLAVIKSLLPHLADSPDAHTRAKAVLKGVRTRWNEEKTEWEIIREET